MMMSRFLLLMAAAVALAAGQTKAAKPESGATTTQAAKAGVIDINSASQDELQTLPGIGPALSSKIISGRPYRAKSDLISKKIIPQPTYDKIKAQIIARQKK